MTFSDGSSEAFDTVVAAVGRAADTSGLNLAAVGVEASPLNGHPPSPQSPIVPIVPHAARAESPLTLSRPRPSGECCCC